MRSLKALGLALVMLTGSQAFGAEKYASVEISLDEAVTKQSAGLRTLFVILYDADSQRPMPYGALKVDLKADAKGVVYKGDLTSDNVMTMGGGPAPKNLRLKARLDKDGSAGMDQAGDLVGTADKIKPGDSVKLKINKAI